MSKLITTVLFLTNKQELSCRLIANILMNENNKKTSLDCY